MRRSEADRQRRHHSYRLILIVALAVAAGRIAVVTRDGVTAFLSANDRSRWCTVASLVERGTYEIDHLQEIEVKVGRRTARPWATIDKVRHTGPDGELHYYSSKPPLFPTMVAGVYAVARAGLGMNLTDQPMYMTRIVLALVNLPLLALFYFATASSIDRICRAEWSRWFLALAVGFGTMMLPFATSLNNHLPAAAAMAVVMWIYLRSAELLDETSDLGGPGVSRWWWFAAGVASAFAAANELPALSMMVFWGALCWWIDRSSWLPWLAGVAVVAAGFFGTNWLAHESWRPPYAHRGDGVVIADLASTAAGPADPELRDEVLSVLAGLPNENDPASVAIEPSDEDGRWVVQSGGRLYSLRTADSQRWRLARWDDWYEYPGTHWKPENLSGVDRGEPSRAAYFAHMTVGHHGLFSLTPIWLIVPVGLIYGLGFGPVDFRRFVLATAVATSVCVAFYIARPEIDRNYGGVSVCFRWLLWFAPLWLLVIAPVVERMAEARRFRLALTALLALSVFSMSTALANPWQHPWLYQFWAFLGWIDPS